MPESLRAARRALDQHPVLSVSGESLWDEPGSRWAIPVDVTLERGAGDRFPVVSKWFILVSASYPWGEIEVYPAKNGGIVETYPHQDHNAEGDAKQPWRDGDVCIKTTSFTLGRVGNDLDPKGDASTRLIWYAGRLVEWMKHAAAGTLALEGEPFELPKFGAAGGTVGFAEDDATYEIWSQLNDQSGTAELAALGDPFPYVVKRFLALGDKELVAPRWGTHIEGFGVSLRAAWIRLQEIPVVGPYGAPMRWGELRDVALKSGVHVDELLRPALRAIRGRKAGIVLVGFPIPRRFDEASSIIHWQPAFLDDLSSGSIPGFRSNEASYWKRDLGKVIADARRIAWHFGRNWSVEQLSTRGQLGQRLRSRRILLIGAGALGSMVAELLVRGGASTLCLVDGENLEAGNLSRHTLTLADVDKPKAKALASRLNLLSPYARVSAICASFSVRSDDHLKRFAECDLVVECTGEDEILHALSEHELEAPIDFVSISLGRGAARGYVYTSRGTHFPADAFWKEVAPFLGRDRSEHPDSELPWEGVGCWHPVFPASAHQVWSAATGAVRAIDRWYEDACEGSKFGVLRLAGNETNGADDPASKNAD